MTVESTWTERVGQTPSAVFSVGSEAVVAAATVSPSVHLRFPPSDWFCSPETASGLRGAQGATEPAGGGWTGGGCFRVTRLQRFTPAVVVLRGVSPAVGVLRGGLHPVEANG